jgi:3-oxoadipate enol-lactonase
MPYGMRQVIADVDTPFQVDFPGGQSWSFTAEDARQISQPVLLVVGAETIPLFKEIAKLVTAWFPGSESLVIPNAPHAMILPHSGAVAEGLAGFLARHP